MKLVFVRPRLCWTIFPRIFHLFEIYADCIEFWMLGYLYKLLKIYLKEQCQAWCYVQSNSSFILELSSLFTCKISRLATTWTRVISKCQWLLKMENCFFILTLRDIFVRSRRFEKAFCHAVEADIQDYASAQNIFTGIFLHTTYYYYGEADVRADRLCSAAFV